MRSSTTRGAAAPLMCVLWLGVSGCGFQPLSPGDAAAADQAVPSGGDSAIPPGADLASAPGAADLAIPVGGGSGPGPKGALPTGFCCAADTDCRSRVCMQVGATKMCSDDCTSDDPCNGPLNGFHCNGGQCVPVANPFTCVDAAQFHYGAKPLGACCTATHDGNAGVECTGGRCDGFGADSNPFICTNACLKDKDCPGSFTCLSIGNQLSVCAPLADPYTCT